MFISGRTNHRALKTIPLFSKYSINNFFHCKVFFIWTKLDFLIPQSRKIRVTFFHILFISNFFLIILAFFYNRITLFGLNGTASTGSTLWIERMVVSPRVWGWAPPCMVSRCTRRRDNQQEQVSNIQAESKNLIHS